MILELVFTATINLYFMRTVLTSDERDGDMMTNMKVRETQ